MSGFLSNIQQEIGALFRAPRSIGTIIPDAVFEEIHRDDMTITDHPVEIGAAITDHAFIRPFEVTIRAGWSNGSPQAAFAATLLGIPTLGILPSFSETYVLDVYNALQKLQQSRQPFVLVTGKRTYQNMLIQTMTVTTSEGSEFALDVTVVCRQIILVSTTTTTLPPASSQAQPQDTAGQSNTGSKLLTAPPAGQQQSILSHLFGGVSP